MCCINLKGFCLNSKQNVEFTLGEETEKSSKKELSSDELSSQLERLIQDQADNQRVFDWVEVRIDEDGGWGTKWTRVQQ